MSATDFKAKCPEILELVPQDGLAITKDGKSVARIYPESKNMLRFLGSAPRMIIDEELFGTGVSWEAESSSR